MFMMALSFPPSYSSPSAIFPYPSVPIQKDPHIDEGLVHGEQARPVLFPVLWTTFTKDEVLDQA